MVRLSPIARACLKRQSDRVTGFQAPPCSSCHWHWYYRCRLPAPARPPNPLRNSSRRRQAHPVANETYDARLLILRIMIDAFIAQSKIALEANPSIPLPSTRGSRIRLLNFFGDGFDFLPHMAVAVCCCSSFFCSMFGVPATVVSAASSLRSAGGSRYCPDLARATMPHKNKTSSNFPLLLRARPLKHPLRLVVTIPFLLCLCFGINSFSGC